MIGTENLVQVEWSLRVVQRMCGEFGEECSLLVVEDGTGKAASILTERRVTRKMCKSSRIVNTRIVDTRVVDTSIDDVILTSSTDSQDVIVCLSHSPSSVQVKVPNTAPPPRNPPRLPTLSPPHHASIHIYTLHPSLHSAMYIQDLQHSTGADDTSKSLHKA